MSPNHLRKGVAQRIYQELLLKAREMEQYIITSDVSLSAKIFFQKQGFTIVSERQNRIGIESLRNYKMILHIEK